MEVRYEPVAVGVRYGEAKEVSCSGDTDVQNPQRLGDLHVGHRAGDPGRHGVVGGGAGRYQEQDGVGLVALDLVHGAEARPGAGRAGRGQCRDGTGGGLSS